MRLISTRIISSRPISISRRSAVLSVTPSTRTSIEPSPLPRCHAIPITDPRKRVTPLTVSAPLAAQNCRTDRWTQPCSSGKVRSCGSPVSVCCSAWRQWDYLRAVSRRRRKQRRRPSHLEPLLRAPGQPPRSSRRPVLLRRGSLRRSQWSWGQARCGTSFLWMLPSIRHGGQTFRPKSSAMRTG